MKIKENNKSDGTQFESAPPGMTENDGRLKPWKKPQVQLLDIRKTGSGIHPPPERGNHRSSNVS